MGVVFYAWELGGGLGHLSPVKPILKTLTDAGHSIFIAVRESAQVKAVFRDFPFRVLQAPFQSGTHAPRFQPPHTFAHILHNTCLGDLNSLAGRVASWRTLFDLTKPDLLICDHAPTALLAARGRGVKRVTFGTGFCAPPPLKTFPNWRPEKTLQQRSLEREETQTLAGVNRWLMSEGQTPLVRLSQLYSEVDDVLLTTFPELDHFGVRPNVKYSGVWPNHHGEPFSWPDGEGKRVFGYLKSFPRIADLLDVLRDSKAVFHIYAAGVARKVIAQFRSERVHFSNRPVDMMQARRECDAAILHGGHGTTASMLLAGKPVMLLPQQLEQRLTAQNVAKMNAGGASKSMEKKELAAFINSFVLDSQYNEGARAFADRYADFDSAKAMAAVSKRCEDLLPS